MCNSFKESVVRICCGRAATGCCTYAKAERKKKESEEVALGPGAGSTKHQLAATPAAWTHKVKLLFKSQQGPERLPQLEEEEEREEKQANRKGISTSFFSRPAGQGASGLMEEEEEGQGCGCVARGLSLIHI